MTEGVSPWTRGVPPIRGAPGGRQKLCGPEDVCRPPGARRTVEGVAVDRPGAHAPGYVRSPLWGFWNRLSVYQHIVSPRWAGWQLVQVDVEERVHLHAVWADVDQSHVEPARVVERREERVRHVHPLAVAGDVHHGKLPFFVTAGQSGGCDATPCRVYYLQRDWR